MLNKKHCISFAFAITSLILVAPAAAMSSMPSPSDIEAMNTYPSLANSEYMIKTLSDTIKELRKENIQLREDLARLVGRPEGPTKKTPISPFEVWNRRRFEQ